MSRLLGLVIKGLLASFQRAISINQWARNQAGLERAWEVKNPKAFGSEDSSFIHSFIHSCINLSN